jgi:hypothetical protein
MALAERPERVLTEVDVSRLAREISRNLKPLALTLDQLQITNEQWDRVQNNPIFQQRLVEEAAIWSASTKKSIEDRISTKAAVMIEELLIDAVGMVQNPDLPGVARVQSLQFLANMAKLGDKAVRDDGSGRVQININIGPRTLSFDKETTEPVTIEGTAEVSP